MSSKLRVIIVAVVIGFFSKTPRWWVFECYSYLSWSSATLALVFNDKIMRLIYEPTNNNLGYLYETRMMTSISSADV